MDNHDPGKKMFNVTKKQSSAMTFSVEYNLRHWCYICVCRCFLTVKEKPETKPRQHTIDLSQLAVPIQLSQEKKVGPDSPRPCSESEPSAELPPAGASHPPPLTPHAHVTL